MKRKLSKKVGVLFLATVLFLSATVVSFGAEDYHTGIEEEDESESWNDEIEENEIFATPIKDWHDLNELRNNLGAAALLENDIDENSLGYDDWVDTVEGWDPIGDEDTQFIGTFDGNGYTISDLYINRPTEEFVGLFGYTDAAEIRDLNLVDVDVTGGQSVGGLVGSNEGLITQSSASGSVEGTYGWYKGVLVGRNRDDGEIISSYSSGVVEGISGLGGICGLNRGIISNSYSTADVIGTENNIGGLVGEQRGEVTDTYATGGVSGGNRVGGLVGVNHGIVDNSFSIGEVTSDGSSVGGLSGSNWGTVSNSFWDTETSNQTTSAGSEGKTTAEMKDVATFTDTSNDDLGEAWDFVGNPYDDEGEEDIWHIDETINDGYPYLTFSPYTIHDWYELDGVRNDLDGDYFLMIDIDENSPGYHDLVNTPEGLAPIGEEGAEFTGTFDGQGHEIRSLFIDRSETGVGLFGHISEGIIQNVGIIDANINGQGWVGALVGYNYFGEVSKSYSTGSVTGISHRVGGLIGNNEGGTIVNCYSIADATGSNNNVGGLVGLNIEGGEITNSYASGDVNGVNLVGGLMGRNSQSTVSNSYATGNITGSTMVGGLIGDNLGGIVSYSYASGNVSGNDVGGLVGLNDGGEVKNSFWDIENSGLDVSDGGTGKTTAEMTDVATFTDLSTEGLDEPWDFYGDPNDDEGDEDIWHIHERINDGYPFLTMEPSAIYDWYDLYAVRNDLDGDYILMTDLDENSAGHDELVDTEKGFEPIGDPDVSFTGTFDGNGNEISDLYINRTDEIRVGLFGSIQDATIVNLMVGGSVTGPRWVGGVVGYSHSGNTLISNTVSNVDVKNVGTIGFRRVGGLVGILHEDNRINNSSAHGTITGPDGANLGGLVGRIHDSDVIVETSYATGRVNEGESGDDVGGLIGFKHGDAEVLNSFWDIEASEQEESDGGTGKTTEEMQNYETFTDTDTEGLDEPWDIEILSGPHLDDDYPYLSWETGNGPVWYIEQTTYAVSFDASVEDIVAGGQPIVEVYDAVDQFGDPLSGAYEVNIEIDGNVQDITISFAQGEMSWIWEPMTQADEYNAEVTIDGMDESDTFKVDPEEVDTVIISPVDDQTIVTAGEDLSFTAEAVDEYDNPITDDVEDFDWNGAEDGMFNEESVGDHDVTATYDGVSSDPVTITVEPSDVDYIEISPQDSTIDAGDSKTYTAVAYDEYDNEIDDVTDDTDWGIDAEAGGSWDDNVYTSERAGTWTVTGTYEGETDEATLEVEFDEDETPPDDDDETPPDDDDETPPDDDDETPPDDDDETPPDDDDETPPDDEDVSFFLDPMTIGILAVIIAVILVAVLLAMKKKSSGVPSETIPEESETPPPPPETEQIDKMDPMDQPEPLENEEYIEDFDDETYPPE